jgi:hypothetical protein
MGTRQAIVPGSETDSMPQEQSALRRLTQREEVLEICFWFEGEGFGDRFSVASIKTFLTLPDDEIGNALESLVEEGAFVHDDTGYWFSSNGKHRASRLFHETFAEFQVGTHGECTAGCCDGENEERGDNVAQGGASSQG